MRTRLSLRLLAVLTVGLTGVGVVEVDSVRADQPGSRTARQRALNEGTVGVGRYYLLKPVSGPDLCIDTSSASQAPGAKIVQWACNGQDNQRIYFRQVAANNYQLAFQHSAQCLRVKGGSLASGALMVQEACARTWSTAAAGTVFTRIPKGATTPTQFQLKSTTSGMCLKSPNGTGGSQLIQAACATTADFLWTTTVVAYVPASDSNGRWSSVIPLGSPIVPAAAAIRPDGKVLAWSSWSGQVFGEPGIDQTVTVLFDPTTNGSSVSTVNNTMHDMFCPGTSLLADGRLLVTGGDSIYTDKLSIYNPATSAWQGGAKMTQPRWYNTNVTLADGRVLTLGGNTYSSRDLGSTGNGEIYNPTTNTWTKADGIALAPFVYGQRSISRPNEHIRMFVAPDGRVIATGPTISMQWISTSGTGSVAPAGKRGKETTQNDITVMYDVGKILTAGGTISYNRAYNSSTPSKYIPSGNQSQIVDVNDSALVDGLARVQQVAPMRFPRTSGNGVVLPDGQVFVTGGIDNSASFTDAGAILASEMFDPSTNTWREMPAMTTPRGYHSWSLLLPDGRVMVGGGGLCTGNIKNCPNHPNVEFFSPPYLFAPGRPAITAAPNSVVANGSAFAVSVNGTVTGFSLVRMSSVTHSTNTDQRFMRLAATQTGGGWSVSSPINRNVAPPGYYMLFALNGGVPSVAKVIQIR
jgi:galactose oxidase